ncbi:MAG: DUF1292 domain-containing protein [Clostridium sp.]|nr:DUF1292 domain-containing protein [Clostridium sp.]MBO6150716.1 DUF1292 domain-containing protein [Clostridium sp.]
MEKNLNNTKVQKPENITLIGEDGEEIVFYVLEQTRQNGVNYLLVTDTADEDGDCWIMKDAAGPESEESVYEFVEDEDELGDMFRIFEELMSDADIDFRS